MFKIWKTKIYNFFSKSINLSLLNAVLILCLIASNSYFQAFCNPTPWATVLLAVCFTNMVLYPFLERSKFLVLTSFINGVSLFVFTYCITFIGFWNYVIIGFFMVGFPGILALVSPFFVAQLIWKNWLKPKSRLAKHSFIAALFICSLSSVYVGIEYRKACSSIEAFKQSGYKEFDPSFMNEKILGVHFIYHTSYCPYDGWRPPKHEPILVIGRWLNGMHDPLDVNLKKRLDIYRQFFPSKTYKFDCSCGIQESASYHNDPIWH